VSTCDNDISGQPILPAWGWQACYCLLWTQMDNFITMT